MSFPVYDEYKDSGVEWLGAVPQHWEVTPLMWLTPDDRRIMYGIILPGPNVEDGVPIVKGGDVKPGRLCVETLNRTTYEIESKYVRSRLRGGDIVYSIRGSIGDAELVPDELTDANITQDAARISPLPSIDRNWLLFALRSNGVFSQLDETASGATIRGINIGSLKRARVPLPPPDEQQAISSFLDVETSKIDALVFEQRRLIELLKEKRQAVISHAVTKGLNPNAPMKPSGIQWLGDVPQHWNVARMKWVAKMESGHTPDKKVASYWENCEIPWVSLNDTKFLKDNDYISDTAYFVNELGIANSSARLLPPRAVVFSRDATIGRCAITTREMAVSQHFIAWICGDSIVPEYLLFRLRSMTQELDRLTTGATLKTIGMPDVKTLATPVPPLDEQQSIVEWISRQTEQLDGLLAEAARAIELLQERRTALISAAVTGKIDVRNFACQGTA